MPAQIDILSDQRARVVAVTGDLDIVTAPSLRQAVTEAVTSGEAEVVLDLREVGTIDSGMLGVLVGAFKRARAEDCLLTLVCSAQVRDIVPTTGLAKVLPVAESHPSLRRNHPN